ncbi:MAG TPA: glycosyltransferase [Acidimicrobiales bacterium]|nr:glycosyltransferase [Acidimicrobiales bacterium]
MSGLRIDLVSEHASPLAALGGDDAGGQNVHIAALARGLAAQGCDVTVLTRCDAADLPRRVGLAPGVTVEHVVAGPRAALSKDDLFEHMPAFAAHLRRRWRTARPDVVHAHFWMSGWAAAHAAEGLAQPPPVALTFHALGAVKRRHQGDADTSPPARLAVEAGLLHRVDQVIATCSDEQAELDALGCPPGRVAVIPCGVDVAAFHPDGPALPRSRAHRLVTVGRLVPRKGVDDVIRALPDLPGTELVVAGGPPAGQLSGDPEATRLQDLAHRLGVARRVRLVGALDRAELPPLLRSADAVASVPWYEPFGIVPLEAMACGVPVIGSAVGGLLDTVDDGRTGALVPPRDPAALAAAARELLDDPARRRRLGRAGVARVRRRYTWPLVAARTLDAYRALVAGAPSWAVPA